MSKKLLVQWFEKYERMKDEMVRYEKMLETLEEQQKKLVTDIWMRLIAFIISCLFFLALAGMTDDIPSAFLFFYVPVLALLAFFAIGRNLVLLARKIARLLHHKNKKISFQYPEPLTLNSNYPTYIPPNYYAQKLCIEWLMEKYAIQISQLQKLRGEIEQASEQDYQDLQERLDEIIIYEIMGSAK